MSQALVARPFSPDCEQVPIALLGKGTPFTTPLLDWQDPCALAEL